MRCTKNNASYASTFDDITMGNDTDGTVADFYATPGYDLCTGLGSPTGISLINALVSPDDFVIAPGRGPTANGPTGELLRQPSKLSAYQFGRYFAKLVDWRRAFVAEHFLTRRFLSRTQRRKHHRFAEFLRKRDGARRLHGESMVHEPDQRTYSTPAIHFGSGAKHRP